MIVFFPISLTDSVFLNHNKTNTIILLTMKFNIYIYQCMKPIKNMKICTDQKDSEFISSKG